jgi:hypothetical protein
MTLPLNALNPVKHRSQPLGRQRTCFFQFSWVVFADRAVLGIEGYSAPRPLIAELRLQVHEVGFEGPHLQADRRQVERRLLQFRE